MPDNKDDQNLNKDDQNKDDQNLNKDDQNKDDQNKDTKLPVDVDKLVQEKVAAELKDIKTKLDKAYEARDAATKKAEEYEKAKKAEEIQRLKDAGKDKEAYEMQLAEERTKREALEKKNVELTRDIEIRNALATQPFRNDKAMDLAFKEIVGQLVQNEQGVWVHKSGASVKDFVKLYSEDSDHTFLFKAKQSSGGGSHNGKPSNGDGKPKSLFDLSQDEVLKRAREGTLRKS